MRETMVGHLCRANCFREVTMVGAPSPVSTMPKEWLELTAKDRRVWTAAKVIDQTYEVKILFQDTTSIQGIILEKAPMNSIPRQLEPYLGTCHMSKLLHLGANPNRA